jgi:hypothetical protein
VSRRVPPHLAEQVRALLVAWVRTGDALEAELADEPSGLSCDQLALRVRRRRHLVVRVLRADHRFVHNGRGRRGSRWLLASEAAASASGTDSNGRGGGGAAALPLGSENGA